MKNSFSCLPAILCLVLSSAWSSTFSRPLTIGDKVPNYTIPHILQYPASTARLSDFSDKLLILDFMTSSCASCVFHLFRIDSFEHRYQNQVQLLSVTYEKEAKMTAFLKKSYMGRTIRASFAAEDSVLRSWFPHQFVSHMVWIYKGVVVAITRPEYVTAANIESVLHGTAPNWPVKRDLGKYNPAEPLFTPNAAAVASFNYPSLQYYSSVPDYLDGFASADGLYTDSATGLRRLYIINYCILHLYLKAFNRPIDFPKTQIVLQIKDTNRLVYNGQGYQQAWQMKNWYCYEASSPLAIPLQQIHQRMVSDLDFRLRLQGRLERRKMTCQIIRPIAGLKPLTAPPSNTIIDVVGLTYRLNQQYSGLPFRCEVPEGEHCYVEYPASFTDLPKLKDILLRHNLELVTQEKEFEVLVISDAP